MKTATIVDYRMKTETLAKVLVSYTGEVDADYLIDKITKDLQGQGTPVRASFKKVQKGLAVGFIKANREVRAPSKAELSASYRVMSSNILMDKGDASLWEVKDGSGGRYLARHGQENLEALVHASVQRRTDLPGIRHLTIAKAGPRELVAFVDDDGQMDYGFAVATNDEKAKVLSFYSRQPVTVDYDRVVSIQPVDVPKHLSQEVMASMTAEDKKDAISYWTRLYNWAPDYLKKIVEYVNEGTEM